ncbi:MAG: hypothetical protein JO327_14075, partial [Nitrososphaeraceae archaeon]|nr:hypothetical protein [Nitrososphaeraceae archaeon]
MSMKNKQQNRPIVPMVLAFVIVFSILLGGSFASLTIYASATTTIISSSPSTLTPIKHI